MKAFVARDRSGLSFATSLFEWSKSRSDLSQSSSRGRRRNRCCDDGEARMQSPPPPPIEVKVDRPFLYTIRNVPSGACLFIGRVTDPR
ncbi:MAG: hypothetical protein DMF29_09720 [Verrucomicrobia bacterium]|nr:MAG: hypothetical protein DMF29_09720 [Verrucomicrobiota bacterium]